MVVVIWMVWVGVERLERFEIVGDEMREKVIFCYDYLVVDIVFYYVFFCYEGWYFWNVGIGNDMYLFFGMEIIGNVFCYFLKKDCFIGMFCMMG